MKKKFGYFSAVSFLFRYIKKYKSNFAVFQTGWFIDTIINIVLPILFGVLIDEIVYYGNVQTFFKISILIIILTLFLCLIYFFVYAQHQYLMNMYTYEIKRDVFRHWLYGKADLLNENTSGNIVALLQNHSTECFVFIIRNIIHFSNGILKLIILAVALYAIDWRVGTFVLVAAPLSVYISVLFGKRNRKAGDKYSNKYGSYTGWLYEIISSFGTIRMLGAQEKVKDELILRNTELFSAQKDSELTSVSSGNTVSFINLCIRLTIYAFSGYLALNNAITIGTLLIIISYYDLLVDQIWWTSNAYIDSHKRIPMIESICDFVNGPVENDSSRPLNMNVLKGNVRFENVTFKYNDEVKLYEDFSLCIEGGHKTAIVGASGCGKSTLAYLLLAFYEPQSGCIMVDDVDISQCKLRSIRSNISIVSQDILMMEDTIRENILFGSTTATEDEIISACQKAGIWGYISELPQGLDTYIGGAFDLSGGQKQRIAIARAYLRNPKIIIFDEATSSLDEDTERRIHESWKEVLNNRTAIVIAHKLSAVELCDTIVVLKNGKIDEIGEAKHIINNNGEFRRIFSLSENKDEK